MSAVKWFHRAVNRRGELVSALHEGLTATISSIDFPKCTLTLALLLNAIAGAAEPARDRDAALAGLRTLAFMPANSQSPRSQKPMNYDRLVLASAQAPTMTVVLLGLRNGIVRVIHTRGSVPGPRTCAGCHGRGRSGRVGRVA